MDLALRQHSDVGTPEELIGGWVRGRVGLVGGASERGKWVGLAGGASGWA